MPAKSPARNVFSAEYSAEAKRWQVEAGEKFTIPILIRNTSGRIWRSNAPKNPIHLSYNWLYVDEELISRDGLRTKLSEPVLPGQEALVSMTAMAPKAAGIYLLRVTLVKENIAWFYDKNVKPLDLTILVE